SARWRDCWSELGMLWRFSLPALLCGVMTTPTMWAASSILVNQHNGYAEMGVFSAAYQWRTAVAFLPSLLTPPLLSMLSSTGVEDMRTFRKLLGVNLLLSFVLSTSAAVGIILCSPWILRGYGPGFTSGVPVLAMLTMGAVISSTSAVIGQAIAS